MKTMKDFSKLCAAIGFHLDRFDWDGMNLVPFDPTKSVRERKMGLRSSWSQMYSRCLRSLTQEQMDLLRAKGISAEIPAEALEDEDTHYARMLQAFLKQGIDALTEVFQETVMNDQYYDLDVVRKVMIPVPHPSRVFLYGSAGTKLWTLHLSEYEPGFLDVLQQRLEKLGFEKNEHAVATIQWERPDKTEE